MFQKIGGTREVIWLDTSPFMCNTISNGCVQTLNNWAEDIMKKRKIRVFSVYDVIINLCGEAPNENCMDFKNNWCPHANDKGYSAVASRLADALFSILKPARNV